MLEITKIFNINLLENNRNRNITKNNKEYNFIEKNFLFNVRSINSSLILIKYLNKYPLFSSKYLDYKIWEKIINININKSPGIKIDNNIIKEYYILKNNMNNNRISFNLPQGDTQLSVGHWKHLDNFYK